MSSDYIKGKTKKEYHAEYYRKRMDEYLTVLGNKCVKCGSTSNLQIDHIDPKDKELNPSSLWSSKDNQDAITTELSKCQCLCKACHMQKTKDDWKQGNIYHVPPTHGSVYSWMKLRCKCAACTEAKNTWNNTRNEERRRKNKGNAKGPRGPYNEDVTHGSHLCYTRGCKCDLCRKANAVRAKLRKEGVPLPSTREVYIDD